MPRFEDPQSGLREEYKRMIRAHRRAVDRLIDQGFERVEAEMSAEPQLDFSRFADLRCGARTKRDGSPCRLKSIYGCGRCKLHGGLSTGPRTKTGKRRAAKNGLLAHRGEANPMRP